MAPARGDWPASGRRSPRAAGPGRAGDAGLDDSGGFGRYSDSGEFRAGGDAGDSGTWTTAAGYGDQSWPQNHRGDEYGDTGGYDSREAFPGRPHGTGSHRRDGYEPEQYGRDEYGQDSL